MRFDKVALALIDRLQEALERSVPAKKTLIVTVTAPIRQSTKTAFAVEDALAKRLARKPAKLEYADEVHGNQIQARLVNRSAEGSKVLVYVHNPDPGAADELLRGAVSSRAQARSAGVEGPQSS